MNWKDVPIPLRMGSLPRDARGYPIPANVWRDRAGNPHFTINDHETSLRFIKERRCPLCGIELGRTLNFVGGPLSALHRDGCYLDLPGHIECVRYALQVCPYLAAPKYSKRLDARKVDPENVSEGQIFQDNTMMPDRPALFVVVAAYDYTKRWTGKRGDPIYLKPIRPYVGMECWQYGRSLKPQEAQELILRTGT